jgi:multidrug resistance efflux pump
MTNSEEAKPAAAEQPVLPHTRPPPNPVRHWVLIVLVVAIVFFAYSVVADRLTPYTAQATVRAFVVRIGTEVAGRVIDVRVTDNQRVPAGQILFQIDPEPYRLAVETAEAQLAAAGQSIGASTAGVSAAEQQLAEAQAKFVNVREQTARINELVKKGIYAQARQDQARAAFASAQAAVNQAQAQVEQAQHELGPKGEDNPQLRQAAASLAQARLNLIHTTVAAPSDGVISNLQLSLGQYAAVGQPALTFIDARSIWVIANFRENSLENVATGAFAEFVFDVLPGRVFAGRVDSVGWGVGQDEIDPSTGLPIVRNQTGWIRDPQRFPVRLELDRDEYLPGLRYGSQVNVIVFTGDHPIANAIGWLWIRLVSLLSYVI